MDSVIVLSIFVIFGYIIYAKLRSKNHPAIQKMQDMMNKNKEKPVDEEEKWTSEQIFPQKRQIM